MKAKKLPSGNYRVQVVVGHDANGKRIVKSFTAEEEWTALEPIQYLFRTSFLQILPLTASKALAIRIVFLRIFSLSSTKLCSKIRT
jgi:hypothetical protein